MNGTVARQMNAGNRDSEVLQPRIAPELIGVRKWSVNGHGTGKRGLTGEPRYLSCLEKAFNIEL